MGSLIAIALAAATAPAVALAEGRSHSALPRDAAALETAKRFAGAHGSRPEGVRAISVVGSTSTAPAAVVNGSLNQPGLAATDNSSTNDGTPPDTTGAIGPNFYVEFVNTKIAVYSRATLALVGAVDGDSFVGDPGRDVFDIQIQWDPEANRWFYLADDVPNSGNSGYELAYGFSKTADPSDLASGWCKYFVPSTGTLFDDFPKLGHNDTHLIFGTNVFDNTKSPPNDFLSARIWTVPKPANGDITGSCPSQPAATSTPADPTTDPPLATSDGDPAFTPVPANTSDSSTDGYVVAAGDPFGPSSGHIMAWHVDASGGVVEDGSLDVGVFGVPANVPQPGTSRTLDSSDTRLTQAVAHTDPAFGQEAVWTQHTIAGPGGRSVVRWYELLPGGGTVAQEGVISSATNFVFNGAVSPGIGGDRAAIFYNTGGAAQFADIRAQSRSSATPSGAMTGEITLGTSSNAYLDNISGSCPSGNCRWGDYAGASPDPLDSTVVWGSSQLNGPLRVGGRPPWATRNFAVVTTDAPPPPPPPPPQPPPVADTTPPILKLSFKKVQKLRTVLKKGVAANAICNEACTLRFQLQLPRKIAKRLHIAARFVTIGKLTKRISANRRTRVQIKLSKKARKRLAHVRRVTLRLTARATDAVGNTSKPVAGSVTLKR